MVKASDSKSDSLRERRFESYHLRLFACLLHTLASSSIEYKNIIADEDEMPTEACDVHEISSLKHSAISFSFHKKYHILIFVNIKMVNCAL